MPRAPGETRFQRIRRVLREAINGEEQNFTTGSIDRAIVLLSIPMILEMAMESLFAVVDIFFVAKIGSEAVATVGLTESVLTLVYSLAIGLSSAATAIMVNSRVGEGDRDAAAKAGAQVILIAVVLSVLIAIPGYLLADILSMMARDQSVSAVGHQFTRLLLTCNLFFHSAALDTATAFFAALEMLLPRCERSGSPTLSTSSCAHFYLGFWADTRHGCFQEVVLRPQ